MKIKDIFNKKNIKSFIEGNLTYFRKELFGLPQHIQEQVAYRMKQCENDCVPQTKCIECGCPTEKKMLVGESCNKGKRFPDFMNDITWEQYKKDNAIES